MNDDLTRSELVAGLSVSIAVLLTAYAFAYFTPSASGGGLFAVVVVAVVIGGCIGYAVGRHVSRDKMKFVYLAGYVKAVLDMGEGKDND